MTKALITGVTGQDGSYLAELLVAKGYEVVGTSRSTGSPAPELERVDRRQLDILDLAATIALLREVRPDEVYHLAGQSSVGLSLSEPVATFQSIASGTLNLLEAARRSEHPVRLFVAGSGEVFGDTGGQPADELTPFRPRSPYGAAKAAAAELVQSYRVAYDLFACVGYLYNHESPRRPERFVTRKVVRGACEIALGRRSGLELGDLSVVRDWGYAPEYVEAMPRMLARHAPEDFVLATGESHSLRHFVERVFAAVGLTAVEHVQSSSALLRRGEIPAMYADPTRAAERLGWRATLKLDQVIERLVEAERRALSPA